MSSLHHVVLNLLGGGFIPKSGVFQCLEPGLFLFTLTVCTYDGKKCLLILRKNEKVLYLMFVASQTERTEMVDDAVVRLPPRWFELQIFRLPRKGGYSTRPLGTTHSLIIWVEVYVASVTCFPPYREKGVQLGKEGQERGLRRERRKELHG
jgi:hypothetical protein